MNYSFQFLFCILLIKGLEYVRGQECDKTDRPNIIFIMADDAGWNDFSFHGSPQIPTPNIDALGLSGMIINKYYGSPLCTPTRAAVMTGKHPIHLKLQHFVITGSTADGLPLSEKLMPEYLKEVGYSTHLVGKWHLGHSRKAYTPTRRGFDSHYGYWIGKQDYYEHYSQEGTKWGYDFRSNLSLNFDVMGKYDTDLFTNEAVRLIHAQPENKPLFLMINHIAPHAANGNRKENALSSSATFPLQAPVESIEKFSESIKDYHRRVYAAMVDKLDESVGFVVEALAKTNKLKNSIIVFASDNGGAPEGYDLNYGSNWPLRGAKNTLWDGGTRLAGLIWSPRIQNRVSNDLFHAMDWLPTLLEAVGCQEVKDIDGVSMWKTFTQGDSSPRTTLLLNIDDHYNNSAVRNNQWKLIQGNTSTFDLGGFKWDSWYGPTGRDTLSSVEALLPQITSSLVAKALQSIGMFNSDKFTTLLKESELLCSDIDEHIECDPYNSPCLFDLDKDPCEQRNVAASNPQIVKEMLELMKKFNETALDPILRKDDPNADPRIWGNVWTTWLDHIDEKTNDFPNLGKITIKATASLKYFSWSLIVCLVILISV